MIKFDKQKVGRPVHPIKLSDKQREIISFIAQGYSVKMICGLMNLQSKNVNSHIYHLTEKYRVVNRTSLIVKLLKQGELNINELNILER